MNRFYRKPGNSQMLIFALVVFISFAAPAGAGTWKPAEGPLWTRWTKQVSPENVLREYPRPQMVRRVWINLNGLWDYAISAKDTEQAPEYFDGRILVPFPVESSLSGVMKRVDDKQLLWYRRSFVMPKAWSGKRVLLHFGAVDWDTAVWVNGKQVGGHKGGYDPFTFDITDSLKPSGPQEVVVSVWDPTDVGTQPRGKQVLKPESIWYTPATGIWQTVWLEPVPAAYIKNVKITPDVDHNSVGIIVEAEGAGAGYIVEAKLSISGGGDTKKNIAAKGKPGIGFRVNFPKGVKPRLWSPGSPHLYTLTIKLLKSVSKWGKAPVDSVRSYVGMRKISIGKDSNGTPRIFLNNKPLFMFGPLDQGFWPDGIYTAPTDAALRFDIETIKALGFNMARKHVKVEPARWYYWCDRLGLIVWQDMPSGDAPPPSGVMEVKRSKESSDEYETELRHIIDSLHNYPSIVMWIPFNESWGQFDTVRVSDWVKKYDPSRLVDNASGWNDMKAGDVRDMHSYPEPDAPEIEKERAGVVGEYGGLGFSAASHTWREGLERRSGKKSGGNNWGYRDFKEIEALWKQYETLDLLLGRLIKWKGLSAAVYTQITDVEIEVNGLLTYDREVFKYDRKKMAAANRKLYGMIADAQEREILEILPTGQEKKVMWRFTMKEPGRNWFAPAFSDNGWRKGAGGFGTIMSAGGQNKTIWGTKQIWMRGRFNWPGKDCSEAMLSVYHNDDFEVYLNGTIAASATGAVNSYVLIPVSPAAAASLKPGENVIAATCKNNGGDQFIDVGLIAACRKRK